MLKPFANEDSVYRLLEPVQRAPSVHNTQPWYFRIVADDRIDICARFDAGADAACAMNGNGRLAVSPALRRELIISCGAALYNLRLAIRVTGHDVAVWLLPGDSGPLVLASVEIVTSRTKRPTATEQELYEAIPRRHTNRWPYDDRHPVLPPILVAMQTAAAREGGSLRVLGRRQVRTWLRTAHRADREQRDDRGRQPDLAQWTNGRDSGVPAAAFGPPGTFGDDHHLWRHLGRRGGYAPIRDFRPRTDPGTEEADDAGVPGAQDDRGKAETPRFERRPQLMVLSTDGDRPLDWLRAGQALQHALLTATRYGVSASFLTQPLELHDARSRPGGPRQSLEGSESPESPGPAAGAQVLPFPGRNPGVAEAADGGSQPLPGAGRDPGRRRLPWRWPFAEYPQMVLRVGYQTRDAVITARRAPDIVDCRTGRRMQHSRPDLGAA
jgi:nitroreductase